MLRMCVVVCLLVAWSSSCAIARLVCADTYPTSTTGFQTPWYNFSGDNGGGGFSLISTYAGIDGDGAAELHGDRTRFVTGNEFFNTPITGLNMGLLSNITAFNFQWTVTSLGGGVQTAQAPTLRL